MTTYIIRRLIQAVFVAFVVTIIVFLAMRLLPGDPIYMILTQNDFQTVNQEEIERIRGEYGLDKPMAIQYIKWIGSVITGDLGESMVEKEAVIDQLCRRLPVTIYISILSVIVASVLGVLAGIISAVKYGTWIDNVVSIIAYIGLTIPIFLLGIVLIYFVGLKLGLLPLHGYTSPFEDFVMHIKKLVMPVFCMSIFAVAANARQTRSMMIEVLHQDYIRTARAKGLGERMIIINHALKNALIPVVTMIGMHFRFAFGNAVVIETIFNINGIGSLLVDAVNIRDYPVVQGSTLLVAIMVIMINLFIDLSYAWLDPRIQYN